MLCEDARRLAGAPHSRGGGRVGQRWGRTKGKIGFHGGNVAVYRPRVRSLDGREVALPTWTAAQAEDWLGRWAMNLMLINVSTRKLRRAVRLPEGDLPVIAGDGTSKSAASRRFVALSAERLAEWMASDLSKLDLLVIQIDGLHIGNDLVLVAALGIDGEGHKHPLGLVEGATENAAVVQALIDNLIERGLNLSPTPIDAVRNVYSITSSARPSSGSGTVRPSAFAVLRLTVSSNLVGCWTGRSIGLAPLRIRSTYVAARHQRSTASTPCQDKSARTKAPGQKRQDKSARTKAPGQKPRRRCASTASGLP